MYICNSEIDYCILGPFELLNYGNIFNACFSPDAKCILLRFYSYTVVWDIKIGEEQFQIEDYDFAFIQCPIQNKVCVFLLYYLEQSYKCLVKEKSSKDLPIAMI